MRTCPKTMLQGQAGVWRVASELALRGLHPHFPGVDFGYDLLIDGGVRIQVKCAHLRHDRTYPAGAYWFKFSKQPIVVSSRTVIKRNTQIFSEKSEFVVLWGIEESRFWVVPSAELDNRQMVAVGPPSAYADLDVEKIKELYASGLTQSQIAEQFGVHQYTISNRLRGKWLEPKRGFAKAIRKYENQWGLIQQYVDLVTQAESTASPTEEISVEQEK